MHDVGPALTFKIASEPWEFEQIHRLNYKTFVEEIPQHAANQHRVLVDRFHDQNVYAICLRGREVIGMMALRCVRPFSLDQKIPNLDSYLPTGRAKICEIRLLATEKDGYARGTAEFPLVQFKKEPTCVGKSAWVIKLGKLLARPKRRISKTFLLSSSRPIYSKRLRQFAQL